MTWYDELISVGPHLPKYTINSLFLLILPHGTFAKCMVALQKLEG